MVRTKAEYKDIIDRCLIRARIRRDIPRKEPDRISDLLEDAANALDELLTKVYNDQASKTNFPNV